MTKAQSWKIYGGGPNGRDTFVLEKFLDEVERRGIGS